jgi:hypothetical protein
MIEAPFVARLVARLRGGNDASPARAPTRIAAVRLPAITRGTDREERLARPADSLAERRVHGAAGDDRCCHWTPVPIRGTKEAIALAPWSPRWSRGPGVPVRVPTSSRPPQRTPAAALPPSRHRLRPVDRPSLVSRGGVSASSRPRRLSGGRTPLRGCEEDRSRRVQIPAVLRDHRHCEAAAPFVERSSDKEGVPLEPNGDFRIDDTLDSAPSACPSPVLLIRNTGGVWFAAGIPKLGDDD